MNANVWKKRPVLYQMPDFEDKINDNADIGDAAPIVSAPKGLLARIAAAGTSLRNKTTAVKMNNGFQELTQNCLETAKSVGKRQTYVNMVQRAIAAGKSLRDPQVAAQVGITALVNMGVMGAAKAGTIAVLAAYSAPVLVSLAAVTATSTAIGFGLRSFFGYRAEKQAWAKRENPVAGETFKSFGEYIKTSWGKNLRGSFFSAALGGTLGAAAHTALDHASGFFMGDKPSVPHAPTLRNTMMLPEPITPDAPVGLVVAPADNVLPAMPDPAATTVTENIKVSPAPTIDADTTVAVAPTPSLGADVLETKILNVISSQNIENVKAMAEDFAKGTNGLPKDEAASLALSHYAANHGDAQSIIALAEKGQLANDAALPQASADMPKGMKSVQDIIQAQNPTAMTPEQIEANRLMKVAVLRENGVTLSDKGILGEDLGTCVYNADATGAATCETGKDFALDGDFARAENHATGQQKAFTLVAPLNKQVDPLTFMANTMKNQWNTLTQGSAPSVAASATVTADTIAAAPSPTFGG